MPICYPTQKIGPFRLGLGLTFQLLHREFGFSFGERYHRDIGLRARQGMEIDRAVFERYGRLGLGFENPAPRPTIQPFGHRFLPVMVGCGCSYAEDADPWGEVRPLDEEALAALQPWTAARFEQSEPVRVVVEQAAYLQKHYPQAWAAPRELNPHYLEMSALQNLGSVINTAFSVQGDRLFLDYVTRPDLVEKLFDNITGLMLLCLDFFPCVDGRPLAGVFIGNCTVSMISPAQYAAINAPHDRRVMEHARAIGARFMMHQDSNANPHLENYARLEYLHELDLGQDTDFEKLALLFPGADVNCILFPSWLQSRSMDEIREELRRLMRQGRSFPNFSFTLWDIDEELAKGRIFEFYELFQSCATSAPRDIV
jgi:hypothetical protein